MYILISSADDARMARLGLSLGLVLVETTKQPVGMGSICQRYSIIF